MAIGKNKRQGKKGAKKKVVESMAKKEWYDVVAPANFANRQFTKTLCNKTIGTKVAAENLRGRVYEANLADLQNQTGDSAFRAIKFQVQDIQGRNAVAQFYGYRLTTDKVRSVMKKWCTTIEAVVEVKTADGYTFDLFIVAFTAKQKGQLSKNCYANERLIKWIRLRMTRILQKRIAKLDINDFVKQLTSELLTTQLKKRCNPLFPLREVLINKVKVRRAPKVDNARLMESHNNTIPASVEELGDVVEVAAEAAAPAADE